MFRNKYFHDHHINMSIYANSNYSEISLISSNSKNNSNEIFTINSQFNSLLIQHHANLVTCNWNEGGNPRRVKKRIL